MMRTLIAGSLLAILVACDNPQPAVSLHPSESPPPNLSEWGILLADGASLRLNDRVLPYDLNAPLFSDYALKLRTVWLPKDTKARFDTDTEFDFPVGTIISKTFHYEKAEEFGPENYRLVRADRESVLEPGGELDLARYTLIETRLLVRYADGWRAWPYVWNRQQSDASLEIAGDLRRIELVNDTSSESIAYVVPDANQCAGCHTPDHSAGDLRPLGPKAWQLNRSYRWWGDDASQLQHWAASGLLDTWQVLPPPVLTLEARAKDYLDANCAHCHNPVGAADTSALHLNRDAPVDTHYGICKSPIAVGRGSGNRPYDIYPGHPDDSIIVYRMEETDPAIAMPELGRGAVHTEGVALIRQWIAALPGDC